MAGTTSRNRLGQRLMAAGIVVAAAVSAPFTVHAQQFVLSGEVAASRTALHRAAAQVPPETEGQSVPEPPRPPGLPPVKDDLFAGTEKFAKGANDVTEVNMDPDSLGMVSGSDAKKAHRMVLNVVRTYSYEKPGMYNPADVEEFRRKLETGDWHCSVHTRDLKNGESTDICSRRRAPDMIENAIITVAPKELTFIHTIRRTNGGESRLGFGGIDGFDLMGGLPPQAMMALIRPEMDAMRPEMEAALAAQMAEFRAHAGDWEKSLQSLKDRHLELNGPEMRKGMEEFRRNMEQWQREWQKDAPKF